MIASFRDLNHVFVTDGSSALLAYYVTLWHVLLARMATCIAADFREPRSYRDHNT